MTDGALDGHGAADGRVLLFAPSVPGAAEDGGPALALKPLEDGRLAMPLYTSLESLVAGCGEVQPWVALEESTVEQVFLDSGADVAMVDAALGEDARWGEETEPLGLTEYREKGDLDG